MMKNLLTILLFFPLLALLSWSNARPAVHGRLSDKARGLIDFIYETRPMYSTTTMVSYSLGEYVNIGIGSDGKGYTVTNDPSLMGDGSTGTPGIANQIGTSQTMAVAVNSLHNWMFLGTNGHAYFGGQPSTGIPYITGTGTYDGTQDSSGSSSHFFDMAASGWNNQDGEEGWFVARDNIDSSAWFCGDGQNGARGDGATSANNLKWGKVPLPAGDKVIQIYSGFSTILLCDTMAAGVVLGQRILIWSVSGTYQSDLGYGTPTFGQSTGSYNGGYNYPHEVMIKDQFGVFQHAHNIRMITGGMDCNYLVFDSSGTQKVYAWGIDGWRMNHSSTVSSDPLNSPTEITSRLTGAGKPLNDGPLDTIVTTQASTFILVGSGSTRELWGWGSSEQGSLGTGLQVNMATIGTPYSEPSANENLGAVVQFTPVQITPGKSNWSVLLNGQFFSYAIQAQDQNANWWGWGRNKAGYLPVGTIPGDGLAGNIQSHYPDGWQRPLVTLLRNPFAMTATLSTAQGCYNSTPGGPNTGSPCSNITPVVYTDHAAISATTDGVNIFLDASSSTSTGTIPYYTFSQTAGTALNMGARSYSTNPKDTFAAAAGTYTFKVVIVDPSWGSDSATATVTVSAQTGYYFRGIGGGGSGTACSLVSPCDYTYIPTVIPLLNPGNTVNLNRGDIFPMDMLINVSGAAGNDIVLQPYGTGPDPVIGGMTTLTSPTNTLGNLWSFAWTGPSPKLLTINGVLTSKSVGAYQTFIPASSTTTDLHYTSNPFSTGDSLIVRSSGYTYDATAVTGSTATDATIFPAVTYNNVGGNGAFKIGFTPTVQGAWNLPSAGTVQLYSVGAPSGIQVPTVGIPLTISGNWIKVTGIRIHGADTTGILLSGSHDVIDQDTVDYAVDGIQTSSATFDTITNSYLAHFGNNAIHKNNSSNYNLYVVGNTAYDQGMLPGMGTSGAATQNYCGMIVGDSASTAKHNLIDSAGYIGLAIYGNHFIADSNLIKYCLLDKADGGLIYTYAASSTTFAQREIKGNVLVYSGGASAYTGTSLTANTLNQGIYLDNWTSQVTVSYNFLHGIKGAAIFVHGPKDSILNNTVDSSAYADFDAFEQSPVITNMVVTGNVFGSAAPGVAAIRLATVNNDLATFGTIDNNQLVGPMVGGTTTPMWTFATGASDGGTYRTLAAWRGLLGYDTHSVYQAVRGANLFYNFSSSAGSFPTWTTFQDVNGALYQRGSLSLNAYGGALLFIWRPGYYVRHQAGGTFYN